MAKKITVQEVNTKVEDITTKFNSGLLELKKELEAKLSSIPVSPTVETDRNELVMKIQAFENNMREALNALKEDMKKLSASVESVRESINGVTVRLNSHFIIVHGLAESDNDIYDEILKIFNDRILEKVDFVDKFAVTRNYLNVCYRMGKKRSVDKPRPIAVQFVNMWLRDLIFYNKKKLKGCHMMLTEMLNQDELKLFKQVKAIDKSAWTHKGIAYVVRGGTKHAVKTIRDLDLLKSYVGEGNTISSER